MKVLYYVLALIVVGLLLVGPWILEFFRSREEPAEESRGDVLQSALDRARKISQMKSEVVRELVYGQISLELAGRRFREIEERTPHAGLDFDLRGEERGFLFNPDLGDVRSRVLNYAEAWMVAERWNEGRINSTLMGIRGGK